MFLNVDTREDSQNIMKIKNTNPETNKNSIKNVFYTSFSGFSK